METPPLLLSLLRQPAPSLVPSLTHLKDSSLASGVCWGCTGIRKERSTPMRTAMLQKQPHHQLPDTGLTGPFTHIQTCTVGTGGRSEQSRGCTGSQGLDHGCKSWLHPPHRCSITPNAQTLAAYHPPHTAPQCLGSKNLHVLSTFYVTGMCVLLWRTGDTGHTPSWVKARERTGAHTQTVHLWGALQR